MPWNPTTVRSSGFVVTAAVWNDELVENMEFLEEVHYSERTTNLSVTATTEGTADTILAGSAVSYENVPHLIEFFVPQARPDNAAVGRGIHIVLYDSTTALGELAFLQTPAASSMNMPVYGARRLTPSAASHTYNVKAWVSAGTGLISSNGGGSGTNFPAFLRIRRIPT